MNNKMEAKAHEQHGVKDATSVYPSHREVEDDNSVESYDEDSDVPGKLECVKSSRSSRRTSRMEERLRGQMEQRLAGAVNELKEFVKQFMGSHLTQGGAPVCGHSQGQKTTRLSHTLPPVPPDSEGEDVVSVEGDASLFSADADPRNPQVLAQEGKKPFRRLGKRAQVGTQDKNRTLDDVMARFDKTDRSLDKIMARLEVHDEDWTLDDVMVRFDKINKRLHKMMAVLESYETRITDLERALNLVELGRFQRPVTAQPIQTIQTAQPQGGQIESLLSWIYE